MGRGTRQGSPRAFHGASAGGQRIPLGDSSLLISLGNLVLINWLYKFFVIVLVVFIVVVFILLALL